MAETVQGETLVRGELYQTVNTWTGVTYTGARVASPGAAVASFPEVAAISKNWHGWPTFGGWGQQWWWQTAYS